MRLRRHVPSCLAALGLIMAMLAPAASAKTPAPVVKAQIRSAIKSYDAQLATVNAHVEGAIDEYSSTKDAATVQAAINEELGVLRSLRSTLRTVKVGAHSLVRYAKTEITAGLRAAIVAYEHLANVFADASVSPKAATREYRRYRSAIHRAVAEIHRGDRIIDR